MGRRGLTRLTGRAGHDGLSPRKSADFSESPISRQLGAAECSRPRDSKGCRAPYLPTHRRGGLSDHSGSDSCLYTVGGRPQYTAPSPERPVAANFSRHPPRMFGCRPYELLQAHGDGEYDRIALLERFDTLPDAIGGTQDPGSPKR